MGFNDFTKSRWHKQVVITSQDDALTYTQWFANKKAGHENNARRSWRNIQHNKCLRGNEEIYFQSIFIAFSRWNPH